MTAMVTTLLLVCSIPPVLSFKSIEKKRPLHQHPTLQRMLTANNRLRTQYGRQAHRISPELTKAAQNHANFMAKTGSFSHYTNGGYIARARNSGYRGSVRENIAMGQRSIDGAFGAWRNSGAHWSALIAANGKDAGFGYAISSSGTPYWVAIYGVPPADEVREEEPKAEPEAQAEDEEKSETKAESEDDEAAKPEAEEAKSVQM